MASIHLLYPIIMRPQEHFSFLPASPLNIQEFDLCTSTQFPHTHMCRSYPSSVSLSMSIPVPVLYPAKIRKTYMQDVEVIIASFSQNYSDCLGIEKNLTKHAIFDHLLAIHFQHLYSLHTSGLVS